MTTPKSRSPVSPEVALLQFEASSGLVSLTGAADWLLAGGATTADPEIAQRVEDALHNAIHALPEALDELASRAQRAFLASNPERLDEVATDGWELLLLRDLAEDLRDAGLGVVGPAEVTALGAFDAALDEVEPWLVELDDAREAEADERREAGLPERRWWHPKRPALDPSRLSEASTGALRALFRPLPAEVDAWRRGAEGDALGARLASVFDERLPPNVVRLTLARLGPAGGAGTEWRGRATAEGDNDAPPPPDPAARTLFDLGERGEVQVGRWSVETVIVNFVDRHGAAEISLTSADGLPIAMRSGRVGRRWWAEVRDDRLSGARLVVRWADEVRELTFDVE